MTKKAKKSMEQPILDFAKLTGGGAAGVEGNDVSDEQQQKALLQKLFETQGWAFVKMPKDSVDLVRPAMIGFEALFQNPVYQTIGKYGENPFSALGLNNSVYADGSKRSFTCPTGTELDKFITMEIPSLESELRLSSRALAANLDRHLLEIVIATAVDFFGMSPGELGKQLNLPLLAAVAADADGEEEVDDPDNNKKSTASFALFDAAYYANNNTDDSNVSSQTEGAKCAEHYDPGLMSLWAGETRPGLKLLDAAGQWVSPPSRPDKDVFVLWLGKAAQDGNPKFKPAIHRVDRIDDNNNKNAAAKGRLSLWSELCTRSQLAPASEAEFVSADTIEVLNVSGRDRFRAGRDRIRVRVEGGNLYKALQKIQSLVNIPMSKRILVPVFDDNGYFDHVERSKKRKVQQKPLAARPHNTKDNKKILKLPEHQTEIPLALDRETFQWL